MIEPEESSWNSLKLLEFPVDQRLISKLKQFAEAAADTDGHPPFSDQSWVDLASQPLRARVFGAQVHNSDFKPEFKAEDQDEEQTTLVGAAVLTQSGEAPLLELVVHPNFRNQGVGIFLVMELERSLGVTEFNRLQAWSHGNHPAAAELADRNRFAVVRELRQLRLSTGAPQAQEDQPKTGLPEGLRLRSFVPGQDEQAWLVVNAAAFAHHPEQGGTTLSDLAARMAEDWFDPAGFLLAVDQDDQILGFHWTKIHRAAGHPDLGEVYVVGVAPQAQGIGLGRAITLAGIEYLRQKNVSSIMLYVDADNTAAVSLYEKLGFTRWDTDVMYGFRPEQSVKTVKQR
ncbi:mycothiol synthase [Psychromicrobium lacuslunae]|uniref:Mycothiol acetyltransferase n=1 Tax=Psychromicrobium lacuslunae TaxID=1618207 RepID=A0A0D4C040_9MICC|nr:mycothiol synthase [Psychromicrobium lacuslunae]AJT41770.1 hypothetical protein UM93_10035 [Psychromicrobium lacuslunae]